MPSYNAASYLHACLDSILAQSYENWELLAVNDFSTDNTKQILCEYAAKDTRIQVFENQEKGIISALQLAYKNSSGLYITRMDADDIMAKDKLKLLYNSLSGKINCVATGFVKYMAENGVGAGYKNYEHWLNSLTKTERNFTEIYKEFVIPSPSWMIQRFDFDKIGAFNASVYPEDYDLCFRMYKHKLKVIGVEAEIHYWRDYSERTSRNDDNYSDNTFIPLKCAYFIDIDYHKNATLILWGAGKKGKQVAKYFINAGISFTWVCENKNKIGHTIYDKEMQSAKHFINKDNAQFVVCVANEEEKNAIKKRLANKQSYFFA